MSTIAITKDNKNYIALLTADFISSFGSAMTSMAIVLEIFKNTESLLISAIFSMLTIIPKVIITFVMPKINIKARYKTLFVSGEIICALLLSLLIFFKSVSFICMIYSVFGIIFFILECYRSEFLKIISTQDTIYKYQSVSRAVNVIVTVLAPIAAGLLLNYFDVNMVIYVDIFTYIFAALVICEIDKDLITLTNDNSCFKINKIYFNFLKGENSFIYKGSIVVTFLGGATSILTLAYINNFLGESSLHYTILMSAMSLGGFIGNLIGGMPYLQNKHKYISEYGVIAMGLLLLSVIFKPKFYAMIAILFVSGIISSMIMYYYATQLFMVFSQEEIRTKYAIFENTIDISTAISKPFAAGMEKIVGVIYALVTMGALFILSKFVIKENRGR